MNGFRAGWMTEEVEKGGARESEVEKVRGMGEEVRSICKVDDQLCKLLVGAGAYIVIKTTRRRPSLEPPGNHWVDCDHVQKSALKPLETQRAGKYVDGGDRSHLPKCDIRERYCLCSRT
jgi:hypothetical protein